MTATLEQFYQHCRATDWDWRYSDSREARIRAQEQIAFLAAESNASPAHAAMFEAFRKASILGAPWPSLEQFAAKPVEDEQKKVSSPEPVA